MSTPSAIYVRLPNWLGDVCMSLPSLQALIDSGIPTVVCAKPWAKELLLGLNIAGFIPLTGKWWPDSQTIKSYRRTHRHQQAAGVLLPDSLSSALCFRLAGLPSVGYKDDGRSVLLRWPLSKPLHKLHAVQSWYYIVQQALQRWSLPTPREQPLKQLGLQLSEAQRQAGDLALAQANLEAGRYILIAPTAIGLHKGRVKVWPYFNELCIALQARGYTVCMCPPPAERQAALNTVPHALCLPSLPLGAFARLCQQAAWVVCNDSGVSHVAAAIQAQQLTLCGVTNPEDTGPWSERALCLGRDGQWPSLEQVLSTLEPSLSSL